jgi:MFS family permease
MGIGVGGNLPVDGALFLEFLPFASGNLLTMLSVWWPIGQLIGRFVPSFQLHHTRLLYPDFRITALSHGVSSPISAVRTVFKSATPTF